MEQYISKAALVAEIERLKECNRKICAGDFDFLKKTYPEHYYSTEIYNDILSFVNTLEVKDPYEQTVQYDSIKAGIQAHAETYSFNIESELFNQLTPEQQKLWRKEIEQACISGGEMGVELARDTRYKENLKVKEMDLEDLQEELVSDTNKVVQVRRCLEEVATTINPFIDEVIEQFNLKDKSIVAKEIQYRGVGLKGDFGENIHRSDDEVIYILKEDKTVGLIVIRRTEFNNAEITMIKTEERFKEKSND